MKFENYLNNIVRTKANLANTWFDAIHMLLGMQTETSELIYNHIYNKPIDIINVSEEIGDLMWYIGNFINIWHFDISTLKLSKTTTCYSHYTDTILQIETSIGSLFDIYKRNLAYGTIITQELVCDLISDIIYDIVILCKQFDLNFEDVLQININKLQTRYPEKFTEDKAINRNYNKERNVLKNEHRT